MKNRMKKKTKLQRSQEFEFFLKSPLRRYKGKYIAILGNKVVASGKDAKKVWEEARKKCPGRLPTLAKLPQEETLILKLSWR